MYLRHLKRDNSDYFLGTAKTYQKQNNVNKNRLGAKCRLLGIKKMSVYLIRQ